MKKSIASNRAQNLVHTNSRTNSSTDVRTKLENSIFPAKYRNSKALQQSKKGVGTTTSDAASPRAVGCATPPFNNMGVTEFDDGTEKIVLMAKGYKNQAEIVRIPKKDSSVDQRVGFVDQVSFTLYISQIVTRGFKPPYHHLKSPWQPCDAVPIISTILLDIFGFGVTLQRPMGINFYKQSYMIGEGEGVLAIGGQNDTCNIQIYGQGTARAMQGWEQRLHDYLSVVGGKLSRCDVAADLFLGQYSPIQAEIDYLNGKMTIKGAPPLAQRYGDWYTHTTGLTFYVGKRESGKLLRVYEKGLQLLGKIAGKNMDAENRLNDLKQWVRVECEWHNQGRVLPLDMLINPGQYLAGSYPALSFLNDIQNKIETIKKQAQMTVERAVQVVKNQFGPTIWALINLRGVGVIKEICREQAPEWVKQYGPLPERTDDIWIDFEKELALIPF